MEETLHTSVAWISVTVFINQLIFIGARTWNVRAIAKQNLISALLSGAVVHIAWLIGISIGVVSMVEIVVNFQLRYLPVILCSLTGGLIGTWFGMMQKKPKQNARTGIPRFPIVNRRFNHRRGTRGNNTTCSPHR